MQSEARLNSIILLDDVACEKQHNIKAYFAMRRHRAVDCFNLHQTYACIPKHFIQDNVNFLVLFRQDEMNNGRYRKEFDCFINLGE